MASKLEELKQRFPEEQVRSRPGPKKKNPVTGYWEETKFDYIPNNLVSERLDKVFDLDWTWEVKDTKIVEVERTVKEQTTDESGKKTWGSTIKKVTEVYVLGRLTVYLEGQPRFRDAWGGCELTKGTQAGDGLKIADSNAFKKAAYKFGIGSYIGLDALEDQEANTEAEVAPKRSYNSKAVPGSTGDVSDHSQFKNTSSTGKPNPFL